MVKTRVESEQYLLGRYIPRHFRFAGETSNCHHQANGRLQGSSRYRARVRNLKFVKMDSLTLVRHADLLEIDYV